MFNIIIKAIFWIVSKIADVILLPFTAIFATVFPSISFNFNFIFDYLNMASNGIIFLLKFLMIPNICIQSVFFIITTSYTIFLLGKGYTLIIKVYDKFKP